MNTPKPWQLWQEGQLDLASLTPAAARQRYRAFTKDRAGDLTTLSPVTLQESADGQTTKGLFKLRDGREIEAVLMRHQGRRNTVCVSSQAGCAFRCAFCATGQGGLSRSLSSLEILEQVLYFDRQLEKAEARVTNVVFMGMGEPFHNFEAVRDAIAMLCDESGLSLSRRHVTVSTVGLVPEIERFVKEAIGAHLAVSLHAPTDPQRSRLMPINDRYPLDVLIPACRSYADETGRKVFFEYLLLRDFNDRTDDAIALARLLADGPYHVNLIPYNPTPGDPWQRSDDEQVQRFHASLREAGLAATVRFPMGRDITAACGQLQAMTQPRLNGSLERLKP